MKQNQKILKYFLTLFFISLIIFSNFAHADDIKWISVGMLHDWFSSAGCEREVGRTQETVDQQDGLQCRNLSAYC